MTRSNSLPIPTRLSGRSSSMMTCSMASLGGQGSLAVGVSLGSKGVCIPPFRDYRTGDTCSIGAAARDRCHGGDVRDCALVALLLCRRVLVCFLGLVFQGFSCFFFGSDVLHVGYARRFQRRVHAWLARLKRLIRRLNPLGFDGLDLRPHLQSSHEMFEFIIRLWHAAWASFSTVAWVSSSWLIFSSLLSKYRSIVKELYPAVGGVSWFRDALIGHLASSVGGERG
ncbi:hypothetical protein F2Q69_00012754 [Brassica cretica]|uniref:Uncharacterized protein n=1 Tax=Brassica cretica TaxID=69181 RepID=A0A8S9R8M1_BRACR|nr:hypothetical protein F2Q69_00012754 [Brassica cretica]